MACGCRKVKRCEEFPSKLPNDAAGTWAVIPHLRAVGAVCDAQRELGLFEETTLRGFRLPRNIASEIFGDPPLRWLVTGQSHLRKAGLPIPTESLCVTQEMLAGPEPRCEAVAGAAGPMPLAPPVHTEEHHSGTFTERFKPEALFAAWLLRRMLLSHTDTTEAVLAAVRLVLPANSAKAVEQSLDNQGLKLPKREQVRLVDHRLNMIDLLWQRQRLGRFDNIRHWSADSSPQGQFNFYALLESRLSWACGASREVQVGLDLSESIVHRHMPMTTVGVNASDTTYKAANAQHALGLETGSWAKFDKARREVRLGIVGHIIRFSASQEHRKSSFVSRRLF